MKLQEQLLRDVTARAPMLVMLGLSLLVGLSFWVPPVVRAFSGSPTVAKTATTTSGSAAMQDSTPHALSAKSTSTKTPRDSTEMVRRLKECPLLPSANIDERPTTPFGIDD